MRSERERRVLTASLNCETELRNRTASLNYDSEQRSLSCEPWTAIGFLRRFLAPPSCADVLCRFFGLAVQARCSGSLFSIAFEARSSGSLFGLAVQESLFKDRC